MLDKPQGSARPRHPDTELVHAGQMRSSFGETSEALFLTQGHVYESAEQCEARFLGKDPASFTPAFRTPRRHVRADGALEGAESARATATGMAAVTAALMGVVSAGDHVVAARALFGSCRYVVEEHLPRFGVASTLVDGPDLAACSGPPSAPIRRPSSSKPANPTLEIIDIAAVAELARSIGAKLIVDNVFATPPLAEAAGAGRRLRRLFRHKHIDGQAGASAA